MAKSINSEVSKLNNFLNQAQKNGKSTAIEIGPGIQRSPSETAEYLDFAVAGVDWRFNTSRPDRIPKPPDTANSTYLEVNMLDPKLPKQIPNVDRIQAIAPQPSLIPILLTQASKILKPGGEIIFPLDPNTQDPEQLLNKLPDNIRKAIDPKIEYLSKRQLRETLGTASSSFFDGIAENIKAIPTIKAKRQS